MPLRVPVGATAVQLLAHIGGADLIHVTTSERRAEGLARALAGLAPELEVIIFPAWDCLPYDRASPSREAQGRRMAALRRLLEKGARPRVVITTPDAALQRTPPREVLAPPLRLRRGEPVRGEPLMRALHCLGYVEDDRVDEVGEVANRSEVADIYPAGLEAPYRLEAPAGRIDAIRSYDPLTQRTVEEVDELLIDPASELVGDELDRGPGAEHWLSEVYPKLETLFSILPKARVVEDPQAQERRRAFLLQVAEAYADRKRSDATHPEASLRPVLPPTSLYLDDAEWTALTGQRRLDLPPSNSVEPTPSFATAPSPERAMGEFVAAQMEAGRRVVVAASAK
ncbi:MAG: DEAD/DEAH box helicase, partial [Proteobacteria bacterium]|nr:DEAD/DEAH box helicase [Pseudomonadota bacterium]